jgi:hypothetical protein
MKRTLIYPLFIAFVVFISSCDKIDAPYKQGGSTNPTDTNAVQKILLEEFTGHQCPNCPAGGKIAQQLKALYGDKMVLISIHAGDFAEVNTSGYFTYDFRSTTGNELNTFFGIWGYPNGLVNRNGYDQNHIISPSGWGTRIETLINQAPKIELNLSNEYNEISRNVETTVNAEILSELAGSYKISAYITEDSIVKPQQTQNDPDYPSNIITDYVHHHVLRGSMNGTWGDTIFSQSLELAAISEKTFSATLNSSWDEKHCYIVVFIYDAATYEIVQVEEKRVK